MDCSLILDPYDPRSFTVLFTFIYSTISSGISPYVQYNLSYRELPLYQSAPTLFVTLREYLDATQL